MELIDKSYSNKKLSINSNINNEIELKIKLTIGFNEYESLIKLNKKELNINEKFEIITYEILLLKKINNTIINNKIKEVEKLFSNLKSSVNKKLKENSKTISMLKIKIEDNFLLNEKKRNTIIVKRNI